MLFVDSVVRPHTMIWGIFTLQYLVQFGLECGAQQSPSSNLHAGLLFRSSQKPSPIQSFSGETQLDGGASVVVVVVVGGVRHAHVYCKKYNLQVKIFTHSQTCRQHK